MESTTTNSTEEATSITKDKPNVIGNFATIEDFTKAGLADIVKATKAVNAFPQGAARDLYCSYPAFGRVIDQQSNRILGIISKVLKWQNVKGNIQRRQPDEQFEMLLECNDAILERVGSNLDQLAGIKKNPQTVIVESQFNTTQNSTEIGKGAGSWNLKSTNVTIDLKNATNATKTTTARLITAKNIARPQTSFAVPVDNSSLSPFIPRLKEKPNSLKPLAILPEYADDGSVVSYLHPYEFELMKFEVPSEQLKQMTPQLPKEINDTELVYVDTIDKLKAALEELRSYKCLAVDVEHHSYRSFLGLTCLVQISSIDKDYIFDALELREEMHILNLVLTDSKIVKIFHGADSDIEWLQRDLSLYIVNLFDTYQAAKTLNFARLSLAYALKHYCNIELDKTFQLADWRMRPLPYELLDYARRDTHFLIYLYQCMTNDLLAAGNQSNKVLSSMYQRCTEVCKKRYQKPTVNATTHIELCRKAKRVFDNRQMFALEHILQWRDSIARREDESNGYVLPNHMMLQIAESLPREMQGILACCNPIPPLVRQHLHTLHQIILHAREQPLVKPILESSEILRESTATRKTYNEKLHCTLDTSHDEEFRDNLPTLLRFENDDMIINPEIIKPSPWQGDANLSFFKKREIRQNTKPDIRKLRLPYQRFLAYLPFAEQEKREEAARLEALAKKRRLCPAAPETISIKSEKTVKNENKDDDDLYKLPIKEILKRKHEKAHARKSKDAAVNNSNNEEPNPKRFKFEKSAKTKNDKNSVVCDLTSDTDDKNSKNDENMDSDSETPIEIPIDKEALNTGNNTNANRQGKRKFKNKNKNRSKRQKTYQGSNQAVTTTSSTSGGKTAAKNFDYKNVDFKKFKGGAKRAQGIELKAQFHGKNNSSNKAKNKKFNKLFTFSNVKSNKK